MYRARYELHFCTLYVYMNLMLQWYNNLYKFEVILTVHRR